MPASVRDWFNESWWRGKEGQQKLDTNHFVTHYLVHDPLVVVLESVVLQAVHELVAPAFDLGQNFGLGRRGAPSDGRRVFHASRGARH